MATRTLGTNATTTLTALLATAAPSAADFATVSQSIKNDLTNGPQGLGAGIIGGGWQEPGILIIPNRGILQVLPGDYVGVDSTGWPILVSAYAIANGPWSHS
jgi:hypothetical protein